MTEREIYEKFGNLNEDELNTKIKMSMSEMMSWLLLLNAAEAKGSIDGFRKKLKLMIPDFEILSVQNLKSNQK